MGEQPACHPEAVWRGRGASRCGRIGRQGRKASSSPSHPRLAGPIARVLPPFGMQDRSLDSTRPVVCVVVPVRDEGANIAPLVAEIEVALRSIPHEIVYVDDGSTDGHPGASWRRRKILVQPLGVLRHRVSCGQSAAVISGVRAARAPWVAPLDGDGQNDPADIPALLARAQACEGLVLIAGHRVSRRDTQAKRLASRLANGIRGRLLGDATPDTGCGLKVLRGGVPRAAAVRTYAPVPARAVHPGGRACGVGAGEPSAAHAGAIELRDAGSALGGDIRPGGGVLAAAAVEAAGAGDGAAGAADTMMAAGPSPNPLPGGEGFRARLLWKPALLAGGLVLAGLAVRNGWGRAALDAPAAAGPAAFVLAGAFGCAVGVPRQLVAYAAGLGFGGWTGVALAMLAQLLGCAADFGWARLVMRGWAARRVRGRAGAAGCAAAAASVHADADAAVAAGWEQPAAEPAGRA